MKAREDSSRISPTAHYTSFVWVRSGLSDPALATATGRAMHLALRPLNALFSRATARPNLDQTLLARHLVLDHLLARAIEDGRVGQVVEVACGLSPRGFRFARRYPSVRYVEADLPDMAGHKRRLLERGGLLGPDHDVVALDALADHGAMSLAELCRRRLDPTRGTAIVTEGLLAYFEWPAVQGMWRRFAGVLARFPHGLYLADVHLGDEVDHVGVRIFRRLLSTFARGAVYFHHPDAATAESAARASGFSSVTLHRPGDHAELGVPAPEAPHLVRLLEAWT